MKLTAKDRNEIRRVLSQLGTVVEQLHDKYNECHDPVDGRFCGTGSGGGAESKPEAKPSAPAAAPPKPEPKPKPKPSAPAASESSGGGISVGKHIGKLTGDKQEAAEMIKSLGAADKSFGGGLSKVLEKHPIKTVKSGSAGGSSLGLYNKGTGVLTVNPAKKHGLGLYDSNDLVAAAVGNKAAAAHEDWGKGDAASRSAGRDVTFLHEIGHHIALTAIAKTPNGNVEVYKKHIIDSFTKDSKKPSKYADSQPHEYFAESFAAYHHAPDRLSPTAKKMVESVMKLMGG